MKRISVAIWLALCVALPATAQMYKWVDSDGKVKYSDKPPPSNVKVETLRIPAHAPAAPAAAAAKDASKAAPRTPAEQEQAFRKRQQDAAKEQEKQAQKDQETAARAEDCKRAKSALAGLELGGRQATVNDKGEREFLDDQQIEKAKAQARQDIAATCN